jgi:pyruvate dehydrogenase E1 component
MAATSHDQTVLLDRIQHRVLWLATQQIHFANRIRPHVDPMKVGGHQASCASVVTLMTTLFFWFLRADDFISVKPHASPVYHAIQYLLGNLDGSHLRRLREFGGLQAYPSRRRDPDPVDFSTGSVGLGAVAPNFAALVNTYLEAHGFCPARRQRRFVSLVGDAELDEGSVWEAIAEPAMANVGQVFWIIDLNRQSLDRVIPGIRVRCWREMFAANDWHVIDVKYGRLLEAAFEEPNGELLRICIDELSNEAYQRLLRLPLSELRQWLPRKSNHPHELRRLLDRWDDARLHEIFWNLGGHDIDVLQAALTKATQYSQPTVIFAYTLKGWKLPSVGHPQNHAVLLSDEQMERLRLELGIPLDQTWARCATGTPEAELCASAARRLRREGTAPVGRSPVAIPADTSIAFKGLRSTQQTFGTILSTLSRETPELVRRIVTVSPDVASSTNLGGWINKHDVWQLGALEELPEDQTGGILRWAPSPQGQHIELGISENNLFLMLGQLGLSHEMFGELLLPIGTLYDPFIRRGLDALFYSIYSGAKFIVVGTPSGITLASEGGIHQSLLTASIGTELPELAAYEPCFAQELEWILMDALLRLQRRERSTYLRLTTKQVDQGQFPVPGDAAQRNRLRTQVLEGGYRLRDCREHNGYQPGRNAVHLFVSGAMVPEAVAAHATLIEQGIFANVFNITGPGPLYAGYHRASNAGGSSGQTSLLEELISPEERCCPVITLTDAHAHSLAWIGSALGARAWPLGVIEFGQSGCLRDLYRAYHIDTDQIVATCMHAVRSAGQPG